MDAPVPAGLQTGILIRTTDSEPCLAADWVDIGDLCQGVDASCARPYLTGDMSLSGQWPPSASDPAVVAAPLNSVYTVVGGGSGVTSGLMVRTTVSPSAPASDWVDICTLCATTFVAAAFTPSVTAACAGTIVGFTDNTTSTRCDVASRNWEASSDGGATWNTFATGAAPSFEFTQPADYQVRLTVTCTDGTTSTSAPQTIAIGTLDASFTMSATSGAAPLSVTLTDTSTGVNCIPTVWNWEQSIDGGPFATVSNVANPTIVLATGGVYQFRLTVSCNTPGCTDVATAQTVTAVAVSVTSTGTVDQSSVPLGTASNFTSLATATNCTLNQWQWQYSSNNGVSWVDFSTAENPPFTFPAVGAYLVRLIATCDAGATATSAAIPVTVTNIVADFTPSATTAAAGESVTFIDGTTASGCTPDAWLWEYSDNAGATWTQFSTAQSPSFAFPAAATYDVRLTSTCTSTGMSDVSPVRQVVVAGVNADFTPSITAGCIGDTATFTDNSTSSNCTVNQWLWEFSSDGGATWATFSTSQNATRTFNATGAYQVRLTATCANGTTATSDPQTVTIGQISAAFTPSATTGVTPATITYTDQTTSTNCTVDTWAWQWSSDAGATWFTFSTVQNPTSPFAAAGTYLVRLTATCSDSGCSSTSLTQTITISSPGITAAFTPSDLTPCLGDTITLTDGTASENCTIASRLWESSIDGGATWVQVSSVQDPTLTVNQSGSVQVRLTATCSSGDVSTATETITVGEVNASFTASATAGEPPLSVTFTDTTAATGCVVDTWQWQHSIDNGLTWIQFSTAQNPTFSFPAEATYLVRLAASCSSHGCTSVSATTPIITTLVSVVVANFNLSATAACAPANITFTDTSVSSNCTLASWLWERSTDAGVTWVTFSTVQSPTLAFALAGAYLIRLTATCNDGTVNTSATQALTIASVDASFTFSATNVNIGDAVTLINPTSSQQCTIDVWNWEASTDAGTTWTQFASIQDPTYTPLTAGSHLVRLTATCSAEGCSATSATKELIVSELPAIVAQFATSDTTICAGELVQFSDTTTTTNCVIAAYSWEVSTDAGATWVEFSTAQNTSYTPPATGNYQVRLTTICADAVTTSTSAVTDFSVGDVSASFDTDLTTVQSNDTVTFTDTSTSEICTIDTWNWELSANAGATWIQFATTQNATNAFTTGGAYLVRLTTSCSTNGCVSTSTTTAITVDPPAITANFDVSDTTVCRNAPITLTNTSAILNCASATYEWSVTVDGGVSTVIATTEDAFYSPVVVGTHEITLLITCVSGETGTASRTVTVANVTAAMVAPPAAATVGDVIALDASGSTSEVCTIDTWTWFVTIDGGAQAEIGTGVTFNYTPAAAGSYEFMVDVACSSHDCHSQEIGTTAVSAALVPVVVANFTANDLSVCTGDAVTLTNTSTVTDCTANAWSWEVSTDGGANFTEFATTEDATYTPATTGSHQVRVTTSCDGPASNTSTVQTVEVASVAASFTPSTIAPTTGVAVTLTDTSVLTNCTGNAATYSWEASTDAGVTFAEFATTQNTTYTPATDGAHEIRLTVTCPDHGCSDTTANQTLTASAAPVPAVNANFTANDLSVCTGDNVTLTNTSTVANCTANAWSWEVSTDAGVTFVEFATTEDATYTPATTGSHQVRVTTSCDGPASNTSTVQTVEVASVAASFTASTTTPTTGVAVTLTDTSTVTNCTGNAATYSWEASTDAGVTFAEFATTQNATYTPATDGAHEIRLTVTCPDHGCSDTTANQTITATAAVVPVVVANFTADDLSVCTGDNVTLTNTSTVTNCTATGWSWEVSTDGGANFTEFAITEDATYTPATTGSHQVRVTTSCDGPASNTSTVQTVEVASVATDFTLAAGAAEVGAVVTLTDTTAITNCTGTAPTYNWEVNIDGGGYTSFATTADATFTPVGPGVHQFRLTVTCPDHGCTDNRVRQATIAAVLPCADAVCYVSRVAAENPTVTRQFSLGAQGFDDATINGAGGQNFTVQGHASATFTLEGGGAMIADRPRLLGGGGTGARVQVNNDNNAQNPATVTYTFNEPVCGLISIALTNNKSNGANNTTVISGDTTFNGAPRVDLAPDVTYAGNGTNSITLENASTPPGGGDGAYGLVYFDNATSITLTLNNGLSTWGMYIAESCATADVETEILHCPTAGDFYTKDAAGDWVINAAITAVGEWSAGTC